MKRNDILLAFLVFGLVIVLFNRINDNNTSPEPLTESPTPVSFENELEDNLGVVLSDTSNRKEVSSGNNRAVIAIDSGKVSILADLEDIEGTYQVWSGDKYLGVLEEKKGGYVFEADLIGDISNIIISKETKVDSELEEKVLEASF